MSKIYEIKSCPLCPHVTYAQGHGYYCTHPAVCLKNAGNGYVWFDTRQRVYSYEFPIWCPLEDK